MEYRILILSDTHLVDAARLPAAVFELAERADAIVHAGDHSTLEIAKVLGKFAPVHAVHGNVDAADVHAAFPEVWRGAVGPVEEVVILHDAGPGPVDARRARLRMEYPAASLVVFGHSHQPEAAQDDVGWIVNPGSPTQRRRAPHHTVAWATWTRDTGLMVKILPIHADT